MVLKKPMSITNKDLKRRIINISYERKLSHIGSCMAAVDIIEEIYTTKRKEDLFILSQGHAALALYAVLEKHLGHDADKLFEIHGVHPNRDLDRDIHCSSGSLGHGLGIGLGLALTDPSRDVHCLISDGECAEGSIWEALRIKNDHKINNLKVYVNMNGWGAYDPIASDFLVMRLYSFCADIFLHPTSSDQLPFLSGQSAHYVTMTEDNYQESMEVLRDE